MTERLRILLVVDGRYPSTGGAEMQARLLARTFVAAGHDVRILVPRLDPSLPLEERIDGVPVLRLAYPRVRLLGALFLCARFCAWLWRHRERFDAIHVHMAKNLAAMAGLMRPRMRASLTVKISGAWEFDGGVLDPALRGRPLYRLYNRWIARADAIQCVSRYTRERLVEAGYPPERCKLIPNAVDLSRFATTSRPRPPQPTFAYVGRLEPVKGVATLLEAWRIAGLQDTARLLIAGDGSQRAALEAQAAPLGDSVRFLGEVRDVPAVLREATIYVQPSYREGLSNAVLEAMAAGLPVVASRISGNEDIIDEGVSGLMVEAGDAAQLAAALRRLAADPDLARRLGEAARRMVERRFGLPAVVAALEAVYRPAPQAEAA